MSQDARERRKHGCFYYGCLTVMVLVLLGIAAGAGIYFYGRARFGPMCERYLGLVEQGDYRAAYDSLGPQWRKADTFEDYEKFEKAARAKLGACRSRKLTGVDLSARAGRDTYAKVTYDATFENGDGAIVFTILKEEGGWLIEGVHYGSPLLATLLTCASCGAELKGWVKFCPKCGKPVAAVSDQATTAVLAERAPESAAAARGEGQTTSTPARHDLGLTTATHKASSATSGAAEPQP